MGRKSSGNVKIDADRLRLRLVWSAAGNRHYLPLGLSDTPVNRKLAEAKARIIEVDIATGRFDASLKRYREPEIGRDSTVVELFRKFITYKGKTVYARTLEKYQALLLMLQDCLGSRFARDVSERDVEKLKEYLLTRAQPITAKEKIGLMSACWDWGIRQGWLEENPWHEIKIRVPPKQSPSPFTKEEVKAIVSAFRHDPKYQHYGDFVDFLFSTGCRIGEAIALQWKHFEQDYNAVWIGVTYSRGLLKEAKRNRDRTVRLTERVRQMLLSRRPKDFKPDGLVFPAPRGGYIDDHNFRNRAWVTILSGLDIPYRMPRNNRHTVVSHGVAEGLSFGEISNQTGHSIKTMVSHYTGNVKSNPTLPDLLGEAEED